MSMAEPPKGISKVICLSTVLCAFVPDPLRKPRVECGSWWQEEKLQSQANG